jgi:sugar phosphate isomerase/epimerase
MLYGLSTACLYPQETEKTFEYYCKNGVKAVEIFLNTFSELDKGYIRAIREQGDAYGTKVVSIHPFTCGFEPFMMFTDYPRRFADALEFYKPYFEIFTLLGCDIFVFHGDRREGQLPSEMYFERYAKLYELGQSYGVNVAQENVVRCRSYSAAFITQMKKALGDRVSFVLDTKQVVRAGENLEEMLDAMGERIIHVHLSDNNMCSDCMPIGKGTLDIEHLLINLRCLNFNRSIIIELYRENFTSNEELLSSLKYLVKLGEINK